MLDRLEYTRQPYSSWMSICQACVVAPKKEGTCAACYQAASFGADVICISFLLNAIKTRFNAHNWQLLKPRVSANVILTLPCNMPRGW